MLDASILLLDDEPLIALDVQETFEEAGAAVQNAAAISEALASVREQKIDVAVLDYIVNGRPCIDVIEACRKRGIPVIVISGVYEPAVAVDRWFPKPFRYKDLLNAVCEVLAADKHRRAVMVSRSRSETGSMH